MTKKGKEIKYVSRDSQRKGEKTKENAGGRYRLEDKTRGAGRERAWREREKEREREREREREIDLRRKTMKERNLQSEFVKCLFGSSKPQSDRGL